MAELKARAELRPTRLQAEVAHTPRMATRLLMEIVVVWEESSKQIRLQHMPLAAAAVLVLLEVTVPPCMRALEVLANLGRLTRQHMAVVELEDNTTAPERVLVVRAAAEIAERVR